MESQEETNARGRALYSRTKRDNPEKYADDMKKRAQWAKDNPERYKELVRNANHKRWLKFQEFKKSLNLSCAKCGFKEHTCALDFHHKNPDEKDFPIDAGYSMKKILAEIAKCIVLCANCHRIEHFEIRERLRLSKGE